MNAFAIVFAIVGGIICIGIVILAIYQTKEIEKEMDRNNKTIGFCDYCGRVIKGGDIFYHDSAMHVLMCRGCIKGVCKKHINETMEDVSKKQNKTMQNCIEQINKANDLPGRYRAEGFIKACFDLGEISEPELDFLIKKIWPKVTDRQEDEKEKARSFLEAYSKVKLITKEEFEKITEDIWEEFK